MTESVPTFAESLPTLSRQLSEQGSQGLLVLDTASLATVEKLAGALGVAASGLVVRGEAIQQAQLVRGIQLAAIAC